MHSGYAPATPRSSPEGCDRGAPCRSLTRPEWRSPVGAARPVGDRCAPRGGGLAQEPPGNRSSPAPCAPRREPRSDEGPPASASHAVLVVTGQGRPGPHPLARGGLTSWARYHRHRMNAQTWPPHERTDLAPRAHRTRRPRLVLPAPPSKRTGTPPRPTSSSRPHDARGTPEDGSIGRVT